MGGTLWILAGRKELKEEGDNLERSFYVNKGHLPVFPRHSVREFFKEKACRIAWKFTYSSMGMAQLCAYAKIKV
jgi:hypothetical protein